MKRMNWIAAGAILLGAALGLTAAADNQPATGMRIQSANDLKAKDSFYVDPATAPGKAHYTEHCAACHEGGVPKAPSATFLALLPGDAIVAAMTSGVMRAQGAALTPAQRVEVAEYLTQRKVTTASAAPPPVCTGPAQAFDMRDPPAPIGWGHDNRRFVPAERAGLAKAEVPRLKLKWAFAYPGAARARSQPAFGWGTMFVGSQNGTIYAFDIESGCTRWTSRVTAEVRTGIVADAANRRLYFGDVLGRAYAMDAMTGRQLWSVKIDDHPDATITGTPTLGGGLLYVPVSSLEVVAAGNPGYACCTFRGLVAALDPATGAVRWRAYTVPEPPVEQGKGPTGTPQLGPSGAPVWNSPTYDAVTGRVYFGSGENYSSPADGNSDAAFAVDARTGRRLWVTQFTKGDAWHVGCMLGNGTCPKENGPDHDVAASGLLIPLGDGKRMLVFGQKSGEAWGLDPDSGKILWSTRLGHGGTQGGVHFGMAADGTRVFAGVNDMADTGDARVYDASIRGAGLHAVDAASGAKLWSKLAPQTCEGRKFCDPGISAAVTAIPGVVFAGHLDGRFRAYDSDSGAVLWETDTTRPVMGVNGIEGHGGSMSGGGPLVVRGHLVFNSGYGLYSHMPGNLLMVYAPER